MQVDKLYRKCRDFLSDMHKYKTYNKTTIELKKLSLHLCQFIYECIKIILIQQINLKLAIPNYYELMKSISTIFLYCNVMELCIVCKVTSFTLQTAKN
jgi:hypothetical protein